MSYHSFSFGYDHAGKRILGFLKNGIPRNISKEELGYMFYHARKMGGGIEQELRMKIAAERKALNV